MSILELILTAVALAMDAFAVSVCKGLKMKKINYLHALVISLFFGVFQGIMPIFGWLLGTGFKDVIESFDHWIAFVILAVIGIKTVKEALSGKEDDTLSVALDLKELFLLAIATSIDALAVGVTLAFLDTDIRVSASVIALITFVICFSGVWLGNRFGAKYKNKAELSGGIVLILIGLKILIESYI